jgi:hypothetical protein
MPRYIVEAVFTIHTVGGIAAEERAYALLNKPEISDVHITNVTAKAVSLREKYEDAQLAFHQRKERGSALDYFNAAMEAFDGTYIKIDEVLTVWREVKDYVQ